MPVVWIPAPLRDLTGGRETVTVPAGTVMGVIVTLNQQFPGVRDRLCAGQGLRPGLTVVIDGEAARLDLWEPVGEASEVHFLPAIGGG